MDATDRTTELMIQIQSIASNNFGKDAIPGINSYSGYLAKSAISSFEETDR
ncbi:unnamed protein product [Larinioides sclopetarius]|uniref:Uncharacterized protein n=1 Tax=Larinioides sclopetarius TaxID=280406 RepID=A0AAV2AS46_9ARAC